MMRYSIIAPLAITFIVMATAESLTQAPPFEVASVRMLPPTNTSPPGFAWNPRLAPGRLTWTTTLYRLVVYAHDDLPRWRLSGIEPDSSSYYSIAATMHESATREDVRSMFRQLLRDRFKLVTHTTVEEQTGYALLVASGGSKLMSKSADGTVPPMPDYMKGQPPALFEGFIVDSYEAEGVAAITGRGVPVARLANTISDVIGVSVVDRTGLTGDYYFGFKFQRPDYVGSAPVDAPAVFNAVQDQLGLRLEKIVGPVELVVVDHIARAPTEN